ncbi:MAG: phospholipase D-like domain-containing protein [Chloroflexales bacterium]
MTRRSTLQLSGQAMLFNFWLNEVLATQTTDDYMLWVAAPWVTNFRLPAPYHVAFTDVVATRGDALQLFDVLGQIAANGGVVRIVVGDDTAYHPPLRQLAERSSRIHVRRLPTLHAKAYAGRYGALTGSLNLTGSGVSRNAELYEYHHDERGIAEVTERCRELFERGVPL